MNTNLFQKSILCIALAISAVFCQINTVTVCASANEAEACDPFEDVFFLGESTTTHLRSRGGISPDRVWANESGTMKLDSSIFSRPIKDASSDSYMTVIEAAEKYRPTVLVLSFGLNGIMGFIQNREGYVGIYQKLIQRIREASPGTHFIIQSVYPVAIDDAQTDWNFSVTAGEINQSIQTLNRWLKEMCMETESAQFADTATPLTDPNGYLRREFTTDGIHLTAEAYAEILRCLQEHLKMESKIDAPL